MKISNILIKQREKGEKIRKLILNALPSTIYRLAKRFKLNPSTIRYHLKILEEFGLVDSTEIRRNNRIQLLYFIRNEENYNFLRFPSDLFIPQKEKPLYFYALTGSTFGISTEEIKEWKEQSIWQTCVTEYETKGKEVITKVPDEMKKHYKVPFGILEPAFSTDKKTAFFYVNIIE
ncbi:MAG: ArsR/SmtB family transcription factor [Candidatus Helarchaeota archaeon]